jgi:hypothetical protein
VLDFDTEEAVQEAIFNEVHCMRYNLSEEALICQGALHGQFGYTATSPTARSVLDRTYKFPPEMDAATRELFEEIAHIRGMAPSDSVNGLILQERWQQRWKKVKEDTSSSQSGLHFGHLHHRHGLRLYLPIPRVASLSCPKEGHCVGAVVERSFCYVGKNNWCTTRF